MTLKGKTPLAGKIALVTGAATGIGRAIALALAREGAAVAINYSRSAADARETARLVEQAGARALTVQADVSREPQVRAMVEQVARELGGLDCLVNNAGWTKRVPHRQLDDLTDEIWDRVLATNLRGSFYCVRAAVPYMERRGGGAVVNITSVAAFTGTGSSLVYAASKAGLTTLTKSLARALAPGPAPRVPARSEKGAPWRPCSSWSRPPSRRRRKPRSIAGTTASTARSSSDTRAR
ncbi:MAG TPA: SDR family NAD(P)-dependent oxidoreductase [Methylomirabilota bacterium]|jgi:3-oxoacyl-[acyl-carrier protein] reductase